MQIFFVKGLFSQTNLLHISWDANPEPDIYQYHLFRSVNDLSHFQFLNSTIHPDTQYTDTDAIQPGNFYGYTLTAVDSVGNMSDFSDTVTVGIPKISWDLSTIFNGRTTSFPLITILYDPDDQVSELIPSVSGLQHLRVQVNNDSLEITPDPITYIGQGSFSLRVDDSSGFWDIKENITLSILQLIPIGIQRVGTNLPSEFRLFQNFPNPFNPSTTVKFALPRPSRIKISLYTILGQRIKVLHEERLQAGFYQFKINLAELPSGIYLYIMETENFRDLKRMLLVK